MDQLILWFAKVINKFDEERIETIKNDQSNVHNYMSFWYITLTYSLINDETNSKEYLILCQSLLKEKSEKDSDKSYWEAILNTNPINKQIITQNEKK